MKAFRLAVVAVALVFAGQAAATETDATTLRLPAPEDGGVFTLRAEITGLTITATKPVAGRKAALLRAGGGVIRVDTPGRMEFGTAGTTQKWQQTPQQAAVYLVRHTRGLKAQRLGEDRYLLSDKTGVRYALLAAEAPEMQTYRFRLLQGADGSTLEAIAKSARVYLGTVDPKTIVPDTAAVALMGQARAAVKTAPFVTVVRMGIDIDGRVSEADRTELVVADKYEAVWRGGKLDYWRKGKAGFRYDDYSRCWSPWPRFSDESPVPSIEAGFAARLAAPKPVGNQLEVVEKSYAYNAGPLVEKIWRFDAKSSLPVRIGYGDLSLAQSILLDWTTKIVERPKPTKICRWG